MSAVAVALADALEAALGTGVARDVPAAELTTYRLGGPIAVVATVRDLDGLARVGEIVREHDAPLLVVGRGSNLVVADRGFAGVGLVLAGEFERCEVGDVTVEAGAAVPLPVVARQSAHAGRTGLEFYVGIPGAVGGAVRMNAGGHGRETADVLVRATVADLARGVVEVRPVSELGLGYRTSGLGPRDVVVEATFSVSADDAERCADRLAEIVRWRREHQPGGSNAGSVFTNPPGDSAGRLIDTCGLKGLRVGGVTVSAKHANFFQAEAGATADDVRELVEEVRARVAAATGVRLRPELRFVGFGDDDRPRDEDPTR